MTKEPESTYNESHVCNMYLYMKVYINIYTHI